MAKITIELELNDEFDAGLLSFISRYKALRAQGIDAPLPPLPGETRNVGAHAVSSKGLAEAGKNVSDATAQLSAAIGEEKPKMSNQERARIAAQTRWANHRAQKATPSKPATPTPKPPAKKKPIKSSLDYAGATRHEIGEFSSKPGLTHVFEQEHTRTQVDGRDILEGRLPPGVEEADDEEHEFDSSLPDDFPEDIEDELNEARKRAKQF